MSLLVPRICLGAILDGKFSVGLLDVVKSDSLWKSKHFVVIAEGGFDNVR